MPPHAEIARKLCASNSDSASWLLQADHFWRMRTRFGGGCTAKIGPPDQFWQRTDFGVTPFSTPLSFFLDPPLMDADDDDDFIPEEKAQN